MSADHVAETGEDVAHFVPTCHRAAQRWGIQPVMTELAKPYPQEPFDTISRRFQVEGFIWSSRAPRTLRRQYIATQACAVAAARCSAALVWLSETRPDVRLWELSHSAACRF